jgi:hypothetical protein
MKDRILRALQAFRVERKGAENAEAVSRTLDASRRFWHRGHILLKTSSEPAHHAWEERTMQSLSEGAIAIELPPMSLRVMGGENGVNLLKSHSECMC